jgi:hypothetical protein
MVDVCQKDGKVGWCGGVTFPSIFNLYVSCMRLRLDLKGLGTANSLYEPMHKTAFESNVKKAS